MKVLDDPFLRFVALHAVVGWAIGGALTAAVYYADFAGVGTLIARSDSGGLIIAMSVIFLGSVFGGVQIAVALFLRAEEDDGA
ncbi:MAG: hypothetical protein VW405_12440 [Rhodospirillaceae bacterium]